jgi:hypothetical protein
MPNTDVDLRRYSNVLVGHGLLNPLPVAGGESTAQPSVAQRRALMRWASARGHGVYQLPAPGVRLDPDADAAARRRLAREDAAALRFVFSQLREYQGAGYRLGAVILDAADVRGPSGRAWLRRLVAAAAAEGVEVPTPVIASPADLDDLDRLVPA